MQSTVEFFIEKVKERPCLWNVSHVNYRQNAKKESVWKKVAKECGMINGRDAKIQWKKLRDSHREALRRRNPSYGPGAQYLKPWKFEEAMKFLVPQIENREAAMLAYEKTITEDNDNVSNTKPTEQVSVPEVAQQPQDSNTNEDPLNTQERDQVREEIKIHRSVMRRQAHDTSRQDALSKLFDSLCQKTRELPKYLQLRVQREIFGSVSRAEEEALSLNSDCVNTLNPMSSPPQDYNNSMNESDESDEYTEYEKKFLRKSIDS